MTNLETIDPTSPRLPRAPRRRLDGRDLAWIEALVADTNRTGANDSVAVPDGLAGSRDLVSHAGRRLMAA